MCKALEYANELFEKTEEIKSQWKELNNKLSIADQKVGDIEHFIEFNNSLNAAQGYQIYKLLKEVLEERRIIKNQINEFSVIYHFVKENYDNNKKKSLIRSITDRNNVHNNEAENKKYRVRVLTEIFGDTLRKEA